MSQWSTGRTLCVLAIAAALPVGASLFKSGRQLDTDQQIDQALSRLTFGARPGDADRVRAIGLSRWIELELHPERVPETPILLTRLQPLKSLTMTSPEAVAQYPPKRKQAADVADADDPPAIPMDSVLTQEQIQTLKSGSNAERSAILRSIPPERESDFVHALRRGQRTVLLPLAPVDLRRDLIDSLNPTRLVSEDLQESKLLRAVYSNHQLEELLVDFWFNHFNVFIDKGADRYLVTSYERDVIRPHVFGKFHDLLLATAQSPAMLFYLDNWQSVSASLPARDGKKRGLNENYGRELLELHTLGVDGGYTQQDVVEVARCFTGWTLAGPKKGGGFQYNDKVHDKGQKVVLGNVIAAGGGMSDGLRVLAILSRQPATARFISRALAVRFVSDNPPQSLVDRMANTFEKKDGDLREVMRTMLRSPEFWSTAAYRAKVKTPFETVVSALRSTGADVDSTVALEQELQRLGEPLYRKLEPTGYSNANAEWVSSAGLLERMNFGLALAQNRIPGIAINGAGGKDVALKLGAPDFQKK